MSRSSFLAWLFSAWFLTAQAQTLDIYWVDVEGGAATLLVTPAGESVLIDTGMPGERDPGRIHHVATKIAGLRRIDHLVTTHFHIDHFGGAADLSRLIPIGTAYDYGVPETNPDNAADPRWNEVIRPYLQMEVEKRVVLNPGDKIPLKQQENTPSISIRCLMALRKAIKPEGTLPENPLCQTAVEKPEDTSDNANSIALLLSFGKFEMFDGGDLTWNVESDLVCPINLVGPVDVYDVNHHGLDTSNNPLLIRALSPTVAIMSNGVTKGCGPDTFRTLSSTATIQAVYQIHRNLRSGEQGNTAPDLIANLERECDANFIKVTVAESGDEYTVSIPGREHRRTFQSR